MSPPIRDGSGNSIESIRLGDGSEISEVRTGAGDVVFSEFEIPDKLADYDAAATTSTTSIPDKTGNKPDATGSSSYTTTTANGVRLAELRNNQLEATFASAISLPVTVFWVSRHVSNQSGAYLWSHDAEGWHMENNGADWSWFNGVSNNFGSADTNLNIFSMYIEASGFTHRVNGVDSFSGLNTGGANSDFSEIYFGNYSASNSPSDADLGRFVICDGDKRSQQADIENKLATDYGISI